MTQALTLASPSVFRTFRRKGTPKGIRAVMDHLGRFWFVHREVSEALTVSFTQRHRHRVSAEERGRIGHSNPFALHPDTAVISEAAMVHLAKTSRKKSGEIAGMWFLETILPTCANLRAKHSTSANAPATAT